MWGASVCGGLDFWGASVCRGLVFPGGYCSWGASVSEPTFRSISLWDWLLADCLSPLLGALPPQEGTDTFSRNYLLETKFTVQVVFRQPRRVIANGALHLPLMSDFNECSRGGEPE